VTWHELALDFEAAFQVALPAAPKEMKKVPEVPVLPWEGKTVQHEFEDSAMDGRFRCRRCTRTFAARYVVDTAAKLLARMVRKGRGNDCLGRPENEAEFRRRYGLTLAAQKLRARGTTARARRPLRDKARMFAAMVRDFQKLYREVDPELGRVAVLDAKQIERCAALAPLGLAKVRAGLDRRPRLIGGERTGGFCGRWRACWRPVRAERTEDR
jgi:hypothetical protein